LDKRLGVVVIRNMKVEDQSDQKLTVVVLLSVPTAYHVAHDPIVSRSEESPPAKYEPMVFAQEQQKPIVQSKYNNSRIFLFLHKLPWVMLR
jgi:hypothetical protein